MPGTRCFRQALTCLKEGERFVLATILERQGSAPRKEGTHFIVGESGQCFGTIGGGKLEADIVQAAMEMMTHGERIRIESSDLNNRDAAEEGLVCGGQVRVLMEAGVNRQ
ncbi:MAG: XdhC family protein [Sellimonas intestinalis]